MTHLALSFLGNSPSDVQTATARGTLSMTSAVRAATLAAGAALATGALLDKHWLAGSLQSLMLVANAARWYGRRRRDGHGPHSTCEGQRVGSGSGFALSPGPLRRTVGVGAVVLSLVAMVAVFGPLSDRCTQQLLERHGAGAGTVSVRTMSGAPSDHEAAAARPATRITPSIGSHGVAARSRDGAGHRARG